MNSHDDTEQALQREQQALRLQELEAEINQTEPPFYKTTKDKPPESQLQRWGRQIIKFAKFLGFVIVGIVLVQAAVIIGTWLTYLLMAGLVGGIAWIVYIIFFKEDSPKS